MSIWYLAIGIVILWAFVALAVVLFVEGGQKRKTPKQ